MITLPDLARISRAEGVGFHTALVQLGQLEDYLGLFPPRESWDRRLVRHCQCCGERPAVLEARGIVRCAKHVGRNPCAIEGCRRTNQATSDGRGFYYSNDCCLCGAHWRALVPPGSAERRVYQRLWRFERKHGQTDAWCERYWRVFGSIVARARAKAAGNIDETAIRQMFGWD